jgi:hypothetical protein
MRRRAFPHIGEFRSQDAFFIGAPAERFDGHTKRGGALDLEIADQFERNDRVLC